MKKTLLFASVALLSWACDYSVKSNGNIDEAFADDPKLEVPTHEHAAEIKTTPLAPKADSISTDSTILDSATAVPEAHR